VRVTDEKRYSGKVKCGHCGNEAPMVIGATLSQVRSSEDPKTGISWEAGPVHELLTCPACEGITLRRYHWHDWFDPDNIDVEIVYPTTASAAPIGLPPTIQQEFDAALRVRSVSPNAYRVLLGRLLELVCNDRGAEKGNLGARLKELSSRDEIPEQLVRVAEKLLELRHVGAHAWVGELGPAEVPILDSLCRAILEYVYSAPHLVKQAEERLNQLRSQQRKKKRVKDAPKGGEVEHNIGLQPTAAAGIMSRRG
jgi:hypothetical protein